MRRSDIYSSAMMFAFGLFVMLVAIPKWVPGHEDGGYGLKPGDFPFVTILAATLIAGAFCLVRLRHPHVPAADMANDAPDSAADNAPAAPPNDANAPPLEVFHWLFLAGVMGVLIVSLLLFENFGFLAGGPFLLAVFIFMMGERKPLPIILISAIVPVILWGFFWKLLEFPLP